MDVETLTSNWGPIVAAGLLGIVAVIVLRARWQDSARGRLTERVAALHAARAKRRRALRDAKRAAARLTRAEERAERIPPRQLEALRGQSSDASALLKIATDQVMVAANRLRQVIVEDFPPAQHDRLRERYETEASLEGNLEAP